MVRLITTICTDQQLLFFAIRLCRFEVNSKYISEKLCENMYRPWVHCNGYCYLIEKLITTLENETKQESKGMFKVAYYSGVAKLIFRTEIEKTITNMTLISQK